MCAGKKKLSKLKRSIMKKTILFSLFAAALVTTSYAQTWHDLTDEQKLMKLQSFRAANQKYLKDSLHLTATQMKDLDNVNICFLSTLDRIDRYAKDDAAKDKYAQALWDVRWAQVDAIMGADKHLRYAEYLKAKIEKAGKK
jgi:hypothetical protein